MQRKLPLGVCRFYAQVGRPEQEIVLLPKFVPGLLETVEGTQNAIDQLGPPNDLTELGKKEVGFESKVSLETLPPG